MRKVCAVPGCGRLVRGHGLCNMHALRKARHGDPLSGGTFYGTNQAEYDRLVLIDTDECVEWPGSRTAGYGRIDMAGKSARTHILACIHHHGPSPSPLHQVAHSCGNRACMNYRHLRWATRSENERDKVIHGRSNHGERCGAAKLTTLGVLAIRGLYWSGDYSQKKLAVMYGVVRGTINAVIARRTWGHLPPCNVEIDGRKRRADAALLALWAAGQ